MKNRNSTPNRYEYLTQTPVLKLISTLAVPTILSMLVTGIYNTADTFFVGRISTHFLWEGSRRRQRQQSALCSP